ncbi:(Fe-S)-binding protein [Azospirillum halopraeferens]|uniref:(Fe-S)-binding protein n=1 Tax=Azospirillum halopraeferens TaxID=34010 RepID=UPI00041157CD|nr:(Fe-S)-binding protein [Azospirillum halopraeferens]
MPAVGLFVTCLVDLFRPTVGFAAVRLLEDAGCTVAVPDGQTCCGQPAHNAGERGTARDLARRTIALFEGFDAVVVPSGSCAGMIRVHYPELLADDPEWAPRARRLAARTHELVSYLTDVLGVAAVTARHDGAVTYHDSCSGLRELGIREQPRRLLASVAGLELREMADTGACCGFGGTFCVKYPDISDRMVADKAAAIAATGADTVLAGDLGCLLNIAGKLSRDGSPIAVRHVAEVLSGLAGGTPPIGART